MFLLIFIEKSNIFSFFIEKTNYFCDFLWCFIVFSWFSVETIDFSLIFYWFSYKNNSFSTKTICRYWFFTKNLIFSAFLLKKLIISLNFYGVLLFFSWFPVEKIDCSLIFYRISYENNSFSTKNICFYWFFIKNLIFSVFYWKN